MTNALSNIVPVAGVWLVATVMSSLLSAALYPAFRRAIRNDAAATRSLATLCFALIAPAVGMITVLLSLAPEYTRLLVADHCHGNDCSSHVPLAGSGSPGSLALVAAASLVIFAAIAAIVRVAVYGKRRLGPLFALSRRSGERDHLVIDSSDLFAWCCGLMRQQVVVSRGLRNCLDEKQLDVVLAHERAHAARFDNLRNLAGRWSTVFWPPGLRRRIRAELSDDSERACDRAALLASGSSAMFREVIERLTVSPATTLPRGATFGRTNPAARLLALSEEETRKRHPLPALLLVAGLWSLQVAVATFVSHPTVEAIAALGG